MFKYLFYIFILLASQAMIVPDIMAKEFVVVIDPGHGGKDAGALGLRTNEKTINLSVARKLRDLLNANMKDATVVMTRDNDRFVTLRGRTDMANKKHADIFISIHANSVDAKSPARTTVNGASVYTLGPQRTDANLKLAMRENAVMKLEPDYTTTYQGFDPSSAESYIAFEMMQLKHIDQSISLAEAVQRQLVRTAGRKNNGVRQAPFWVLVGTTMPSILVELDYICNPRMEKFMASDDGSNRLARAIYNGVASYRKSLSSPSSVTRKQTVREEAQKTVSDTADIQGKETEQVENDGNTDKIIYKIQFLTSPVILKNGNKKLKGLSPVEHYRDRGSYKFTYGTYTSQDEAMKELPKVRKKFADAFIIKTRGGKRIK